jgi:hypothetical protein
MRPELDTEIANGAFELRISEEQPARLRAQAATTVMQRDRLFVLRTLCISRKAVRSSSPMIVSPETGARGASANCGPHLAESYQHAKPVLVHRRLGLGSFHIRRQIRWTRVYR